MGVDIGMDIDIEIDDDDAESDAGPDSQINPPTNSKPAVNTIYGSFGLLDLMKLYVAAVNDIAKIKPEDLRNGRIASVLTEWTWADSKVEVEKNYQELMAKLVEVNKLEQSIKWAIQRRMNLRDSEADRTADEK